MCLDRKTHIAGRARIIQLTNGGVLIVVSPNPFAPDVVLVAKVPICDDTAYVLFDRKWQATLRRECFINFVTGKSYLLFVDDLTLCPRK